MSQNIQSTINQLFTYLEQNNLVIYRSPTTFSSDTKSIIEKVKQENITFHKIDKIFGDPQKQLNFLNSMRTFGLSEDDVMRWYSHYMMEFALEYIEYCRRYFLEMLDHSKTINNRTISFSTPIGTLLTAIELEFQFPDIQTLFPRELRNILGHGAWWWDNGDFVFRQQNGSLTRLSYGNFRDDMTDFDENFKNLFNTYIRRRHRNTNP